MFEAIICILFVWLFVKAMDLAFQAAWGLTKMAAVILFILALPVFIGCFLVAGGMMLLLPVALICVAWSILKTCQ